MENTYYNERYLQYVFANYAAPVAANKKPASLMTIWKYRMKELDFRSYVLKEAVALLNNSHCEIMIETPLYYQLLCYKEELLERTLWKIKDSAILSEYPVNLSIGECILKLKKELNRYDKSRKAFPHEIGLFMGYPIWDVEGFIANEGQNYKLCGYWKVYEDVPGAIRKFEEYDRVKNTAIRFFNEKNERKNHKK